MWQAIFETLLGIRRGNDSAASSIGLPWFLLALIAGVGGIFFVEVFAILIPPSVLAVALLNAIVKDFLADRRIRRQPGRVGPLSRHEISYARAKLLAPPPAGNSLTRRTR